MGCTRAGRGRCLQRRHGFFGLQAQQAVVEAAGHLGLGQATQRPAPHQPQAALVGGLHLGKQGRIAQPLAGHQNPGAAARCVFQQVAQQLA